MEANINQSGSPACGSTPSICTQSAQSAVSPTPLIFRWQTEVSAPRPFRARAFHGESFTLACTPLQYAKPLAGLSGAAVALRWQTDGMDPDEWYEAPGAYDPATGGSNPYTLLTIFSLLAWGLGYFGMPHILLRFMAIEDERKLTLSRRVASSWVVISMGIAIVIGVVGNGMTSAGVMASLEDSETIIVHIAQLISRYGMIPALVAGVILAGILAATMSTADSQLLAASSSVSQDLGCDFLKLDLKGKKGMAVARVVMVFISLVAAFLARDPNSSVFRVVSFAWAGFGATFGPTMLMALFWKRSNKWGALAGMIAGGVMVFVWKFLIAPMGGAWAIYELLPAFLCGCVAIVVVSLLTPAPDKLILDQFEHYNR